MDKVRVVNNIIFHVPHSSIKVPSFYYKRLLISIEQFTSENIFITDYLIDRLIPPNADNVIQFPYSRLFMDVERFKNDNEECMSKYGMGVLYEKDSNGIIFVSINKKYRNRMLRKYYDSYHAEFDTLATKVLDDYGKCLVIDLHSYSDEFFEKVFNLKDCPDICIGITPEFEDKNVTKKIIDKFSDYGYSVKINYPYSGTMIPNKYFKDNNTNLKSIMIEINKRVYLDDNKYLNEEKYNKIFKCMTEIYNDLRR